MNLFEHSDLWVFPFLEMALEDVSPIKDKSVRST